MTQGKKKGLEIKNWSRAALKPGDRVSFSWPGAAGWEDHTGTIIGIREHPRPKISLRTTTPIQFQVTKEEGRPVWIDDFSVFRPCNQRKD